MIDYAAEALALVLRTRTEQGLSPTIDDEATLRKVAGILLAARNGNGAPLHKGAEADSFTRTATATATKATARGGRSDATSGRRRSG